MNAGAQVFLFFGSVLEPHLGNGAALLNCGSPTSVNLNKTMPQGHAQSLT